MYMNNILLQEKLKASLSHPKLKVLNAFQSGKLSQKFTKPKWIYSAKHKNMQLSQIICC